MAMALGIELVRHATPIGLALDGGTPRVGSRDAGGHEGSVRCGGRQAHGFGRRIRRRATSPARQRPKPPPRVPAGPAPRRPGSCSSARSPRSLSTRRRRRERPRRPRTGSSWPPNGLARPSSSRLARLRGTRSDCIERHPFDCGDRRGPPGQRRAQLVLHPSADLEDGGTRDDRVQRERHVAGRAVPILGVSRQAPHHHVVDPERQITPPAARRIEIAQQDSARRRRAPRPRRARGR